jgi:hypothetical protein
MLGAGAAGLNVPRDGDFDVRVPDRGLRPALNVRLRDRTAAEVALPTCSKARLALVN